MLEELLASYGETGGGETGGGELITTPSGATLLLGERLVAKLHRAGTDPDRLAARLGLAAGTGCCLRPLTPRPVPLGDRWATVWPRIDPVPPDPPTAPWASAGALLARLHRSPAGTDGPGHRAPERLGRALTRLAAVRSPAADIVRRAAAALPPAALTTGVPGRPRTVVHGDWHLGQVGREGAPGAPWVLLDLDDLGLGDPAWDLSRPAGFHAAGLLPADDWHDFLAGYRGAGGPAVPLGGDPWPALDAVARAAVVQAAAAGLSRASARGQEPDGVDDDLVAACGRMAG